MDSLPLELQIAVFEHLEWKQDLFSSALVCRAWRDVAWDKVMWQTRMIRISGLLQALFGEGHRLRIYSIDSVPPASDWNRFLALAAKATRIDLDMILVDCLVKVLSEVARSAPGKVIFPAVHTLDCGEFDTEPQGDLAHTLFAGSPIRSIRINGGYFEEATGTSRKLLTSLLAAHPQVQQVHALEEHRPESVGIPEFWLLPNLRSLIYSGFISYEDWTKVIRECRMLNEVQLGGDTRQPVPRNPPSTSIPSLRRLHIEGLWSFELAMAILESIDAPHLIALIVDAAPDHENGEAEHPSVGRARSALQLLAKRSQCLESLNLSASIELGVEILAAFSRLRELRITDRTPGCQLDDKGVELLCRSLPNLKEFQLSYCPLSGDRDYTRLTPKLFGSFSRHCRYLAYLGLPVTATKPEDFVGSILAELVPFRENLKHLELVPIALPADRTTDFVSFLIVQCPKLTKLGMYDLKITDQQISRSTAEGMSDEMEDAYFKAQRAL